jgi:nucleoside phosphorylase
VAQRYAGLPALAVRGISDLLDDKTAEADADRQPKAAWHAAALRSRCSMPWTQTT